MPAIETAGAFNAETTSPARSPVRNRAREPRKTPGFQRLHRRTRRHPDWLAGGLGFEPPYGGIKLLFLWEICGFDGSTRPCSSPVRPLSTFSGITRA